MLGTGMEATFVPGDPPRDGWLALWDGDGEIDGADTEIEMVLPAGSRFRRRMVPVRRVPLDEALDPLIEVGGSEDSSPSMRAWATAAQLALELVSRGRILPTQSPGGWDAWRLGPLDPGDTHNLRRLADALPAAAHARLVPGSRPLRVSSPSSMVNAFGDAVADLLPRTAAATMAAGAPAFADPIPSPLDGATPWLEALTAADEEAAVTLRLQPPSEPDGQFTATLVLSSRTDPSLTVDASSLWDAPELVLSRLGNAEHALLVGLRRGARVWPPLGRLLDEALPTEMALSDDEVSDLLGPVVDDLASAGIGVLWPSELLKNVDLQPTMTTPSPAAVTGAGLTLESLVELRWHASLDGELLTAEEVAILVEAKRPVVRLRGRWVSADPDRLARLRTRREIGAGQALAAALGGELIIDDETVEAVVEGPLAELAGRLRALTPDREHPEPEGLKATLRPYQRRGLAWLSEMADLGLGGILADDMGLGKTVQLLALHLERRGRTLVVCPASLIGNWEREIARFAPDVAVRRYHGTGRSLENMIEDEIVLVTYGVARIDGPLLAEADWDMVVADEAQAIKNPFARTSRVLRQIPAETRFALTGTPVENRL
ncbi:MAG: ATP-dependent helicase, partial [Acidimicrobiia bacterium]|nr:ATP-dependent helicase [Acidimicrobiia bacterium]